MILRGNTDAVQMMKEMIIILKTQLLGIMKKMAILDQTILFQPVEKRHRMKILLIQTIKQVSDWFQENYYHPELSTLSKILLARFILIKCWVKVYHRPKLLCIRE